jgi:hypothetical protein
LLALEASQALRFLTEATEMSNGAKTVAVIGLITAIVGLSAAILELWPPPEPPPGQDDTPEPLANFVVEVGEGEDIPIEASVSLNGERLGDIYTHQEPHQITETVPEGQHNYALNVTFLDGQAADAQYEQYSANVGVVCPEGTDIQGGGQIRVSDGDEFAVYADCDEARLTELN